MGSLRNSTRVVVALASLVLTATLFLPIWRIDLWAPQYPEGLVMRIWLTKLTGDVDIINGLNHYIGMGRIKAEMFPEFTYLPYIVGAFILMGLLTALFGKFRMLVGLLVLLALGAGAALYDFWQWGYEYGHNLDPQAPIRVPGMAYQPPLIGYKALLNFGAYSIPDMGGWIFFAVGLIIAGATIYEGYVRRKKRLVRGVAGIRELAFVSFISVLLLNCTTEADPIRYGQDACQHCKMTIVDKKFAAAYVTTKGKTSKFDDVACMLRYQHEHHVADADIAQELVADFAQPGTLINARAAMYRQNPGLHSPMGGNTAAFLMTNANAPNAGKSLTWTEIHHEKQ